MFIFERDKERERERESAHKWGKGRERGRHRIQSRTEPDKGLELMNREIMTGAQVRRLTY